MDLDHSSHTAFEWDNYSRPYEPNELIKHEWREIHQGHACYTPDKVSWKSVAWPL